jgi:hypothetical protein
MSRKGCPNKIHSGVYYPRKCNDCDYISNNPSMFHYHKKIHSSIIDKICDHGCGLPAIKMSTYGKYCCSESFSKCPGYLKGLIERTTNKWKESESINRRDETRKSLIQRLHNEENYKKSSGTKRIKTGLLTEEKRKIFRRYAYACRKLAQLWAKDNGYEIGRQTYHVDHIYSVLDGFNNEIAPSIISHPANLRILEAKKNSSKGRKSEMTLVELLEKIKMVIRVVLNPHQHLNDEDTEIYREWHGDILRKDGQPLTEEEANFLKVKYNPFDVYIGAS